MDTVNSGIKQDANFLNLKEIPQNKVRSEITMLLVPGETFANGTVLQFDFKSRVEIKTICANIQQYIL